MIKIMQEATALQHARMEERERTFSSYIADIFEDNQDVWIQFCDACGIDLKDKNYCEVEREFSFKKIKDENGKTVDKYIDILMITRKEIIIIENKVWAGESGMQLKEYRDWAEKVKKFKNRDKYYVLLYPETSTSCKSLSDDNYTEITYGKFVDILENNANVMKDKEYSDFVIDIKRTILKTMQKIDKKNIQEKINNVFGRDFTINYSDNNFSLNYKNTKPGKLTFKVAYLSHKNSTDISQADRFRVYCKIDGEFDDVSRGDIVENFGRYVDIDENNPDDTLNKLVEVLQYLINNYGEQYKQEYCKEEFLSTQSEDSRNYIRQELKNVGGLKFEGGGVTNSEITADSNIQKRIQKCSGHYCYYCFNFKNDGYIEISLRINMNGSIRCVNVTDFVKKYNDGSYKIRTIEKAKNIMEKVISYFDDILKNDIYSLKWQVSGDKNGKVFTLDQYADFKLNTNKMLANDLGLALTKAFKDKLKCSYENSNNKKTWIQLFHEGSQKNFHYEVLGYGKNGKRRENGENINLNNATYWYCSIHYRLNKGEKDYLDDTTSNYEDIIDWSRAVKVNRENIQESIDKVIKIFEELYNKYDEKIIQELNTKPLTYYVRKHMQEDFADKTGMKVANSQHSESKWFTAGYECTKFHYEIYGVDENYTCVKMNKASYLYACLHEKEHDIENHKNSSSNDVIKNRLVPIDKDNIENSAIQAVKILWNLYNKYDADLREKYGIE